MKPPYIAFSLQDNTLMTTTVHGVPPSHTGKPFVLELGTLDALNERGMDESAMLVGKYVIGMLSIWYPDVIKGAYPNLFIDSRNRGQQGLEE
jgi:hypothetical protein